jgi:CubicO group peptidase (beta-lactamase class C family)
MKQVIFSAAWILLCAVQAKGQGNPNPNPSLDNFIQSQMALERLPGVSTVIVKEGKIVWLQSYGLADVQNNVPVRDTTAFLLASISKVFTATAMMQLVEQNLTSLDGNINSHLPFPLQIPQHPGNDVTIRQLMTHTASIRDNGAVTDTYYDYPDPSISLADCIERYFSANGADYNPTANFFPNAPGTLYDYSNMGTALQGYLLQRIANKPFDTYCNENIFDKLCMEKTAWFFSDFDSSHVARPYRFVGGNYVPYPHYGFADYPNGQLRSTALDMANFIIAYLNNGNFGGNSLLNSNSISQMWTPQIPGLDAFQGLNWYREELFHSGGSSWLWGHNGGEQGASTDMYLDPANKIGICVLSNGEGDGLYICDELYNYGRTLNASTGYGPACLTLATSAIEESHIRVYPNPTNGFVHVDLPNHAIQTIKIYDLQGQLVKETTENQFTLSGFANGTYFILAQTEKGFFRHRLIKQ